MSVVSHPVDRKKSTGWGTVVRGYCTVRVNLVVWLSEPAVAVTVRL